MARFAILAGLLLAPAAVFAQPPGIDPCAALGGGFCDAAAGQTIIDNGIARTGLLFAGLAGGASVLFAIIGGAQMLLSFGNEGQVSKGKNAVIFSLVGFALVLGSQAVVSFTVASAGVAGLESSGNPAITLMAAIVSAMLTALNAIFVLVMVVAGIRMVIAHGKSDEFTKARQTLIFALIGAFIINVSKALVSGIFFTGFGA